MCIKFQYYIYLVILIVYQFFGEIMKYKYIQSFLTLVLASTLYSQNTTIGDVDMGEARNSEAFNQVRKTPQEGERHIMTGGSDAIEDDINAMRDLGVEIFMFQLAKPESLEATLASMDRFSDQILSKF